MKNEEPIISQLFKLADKHFFYPSNPKVYNNVAQKDGETQFQRKIIDVGESILNNHVVNWFDIELPVILNKKPRRESIDLIGKSLANRFVICELKFGKNGDNPTKALNQLIAYYLCILFNLSELESSKVHHTNAKSNWEWTEINRDNTNLIIGADSTYWEKWQDHIDINSVSSLSKLIGVSIEFYNIDMSNNWTKIL